MDLILWRHADAGDALADPVADLERRLTSRGRKQAERMARWLHQRLPERYRVLSSPAVRTRETAAALGVRVELVPRIAPGCGVADHLAVLNWPDGLSARAGHVVLVGHQPVLGQLASTLLCGVEGDWSIRKGSLWWLSVRERDGRLQFVVRAVVGPDLV
ncbi:MAG: histidine phosphatase family protein [Burkholderiaceae bacterium]